MLKRFFALMAVVLFVVPAAADERTEDQEPIEAREAHEALREAVRGIKAQYTWPEDFQFRFEVADAFTRPGLGILVAGGRLLSGERQDGAEIVAITPGSPADEAGLKPGDVVTSWNGEELVGNERVRRAEIGSAERELTRRSRTLEEGSEITLGFRRDGEAREVTLVARGFDFSPQITARLAAPGLVAGDRSLALAGGEGGTWFLPESWMDMELVAVNAQLGEYFGTERGVLVVRGPQAGTELGLESGDVILALGDREVNDPEHAMRILRSYEPEEELQILIVRHGRKQTLSGSVPESPFRFRYRAWSGEDEQ
jgi:C-terminal processing protease CtpA/Prc